MHILIIPSWYPANESDLNGNFFREQAQALTTLGHKVGVIAPMYRSLRLGLEAFREEFNGKVWRDGSITVLRTHGVFTSSRIPSFDLWRWCLSGEKLFNEYIKDHGRPDVIHAHSLIFAGILAERISKKFNIPYGVTEHSSTFSRGLVRNWQVKGIKRAAEDAIFRLAVSQALADAIGKRVKINNWRVIPNSLTPLFEADYLKSKEKNKCQLNLISVGNLNSNKGFDKILSALALVKEKKVSLTIVGSGPERINLENQVLDLGLSSTVRFLGALSRDGVRDAMREADAFILASHHETFGIVYIEAMSQGLPVIATRAGGPESIVTSNDGLLVPTGNVSALAEAISTLADNLQNYDRDDIRTRALKRFSQASLVSKLDQVYRNTLAISQKIK